MREKAVEAQEGHDVVPNIEDLVVVDHPNVRGLDSVTLDDARDRYRIGLSPHADKESLDDGQGEGQLYREAGTLPVLA